MKLNKSKAAGLAVLLAILALVGVGCGTPKPKPVVWNVSFTKVTPASIEVDVIGVSPLDKPYWTNVKPDDYWKSSSPIRRDAKEYTVSTKFETGTNWVLHSTDPIWAVWKHRGATELVIMSTLPCKDCDNGPADPRRKFVPLDKRIWNAKHRTLEFEVRDEMISTLTPMEP